MPEEYKKPDGCRAAVTFSLTMVNKYTNTLTARMVCGARDNLVERSYNDGSIFQTDPGGPTREMLNKQVTEVLGAMCLGCPFNTNASEELPE